MDRSKLVSLMNGDRVITDAMEAVFGKSGRDDIIEVLSGSRAEVVSKAMQAAPPRPGNKLARPKAVAPPKPVAPPAPPAPPSAPAPATPKALRPQTLAKSGDDAHDVTMVCEFSKLDDDERTVFGWASITEVDGVPVIDRQGDMIETVELEKAAYDYVINSRTGGHQHRRSETDTNIPLKVSDMIESIVFTPEKIAKMGLPDTTPVGWWVGYKVSDDEIWKAVKDGEITGFSVHGKGKRIPVGG